MDDMQIEPPEGYETAFFIWDENMTSKKLQLSNENLTVAVIDGSAFKTVLGDTPFRAGKKYYFEIYLDNGSLIKIGVTRKDVNLDAAFSDSVTGWAMYNGELRHASNSTGKKYGCTVKSGDVIGVMLDMEKGTLAFSKNGEQFGTAFESEELAKGELYAACAPIYAKDQFTLRMLLRED